MIGGPGVPGGISGAGRDGVTVFLAHPLGFQGEPFRLFLDGRFLPLLFHL